MKTPCVLLLYSYSDAAARPWLDAGYTCVSVDIKHPVLWQEVEPRHYRCGASATSLLLRQLLWSANLRPALVIGFPPCTDLAVSGAKHFARKQEENPDYRIEAMALVYVCTDFDCPYVIENPVSVISSEWRKPEAIVHPWEFSMHIPEGQAKHPRYPEVIPPRDWYNKRTCLWLGRGACAPVKAPHPEGAPKSIYEGWAKLGGKSERTKEIRSETPRGMAIGLFLANKHLLEINQ